MSLNLDRNRILTYVVVVANQLPEAKEAEGCFIIVSLYQFSTIILASKMILFKIYIFNVEQQHDRRSLIDVNCCIFRIIFFWTLILSNYNDTWRRMSLVIFFRSLADFFQSLLHSWTHRVPKKIRIRESDDGEESFNNRTAIPRSKGRQN